MKLISSLVHGTTALGTVRPGSLVLEFERLNEGTETMSKHQGLVQPTVLLIGLTVFLLAGTTWASGPIVAPESSPRDWPHEAAPPSGLKALGDPTDWLASALAGADYIVSMQADITEDNAGNGYPDLDPDDGGWDWVTTAFEHSPNPSSRNLYGITAMGLLQAHLLDPTPTRLTALADAADHIVAEGPTQIRTGSDILFLCDFADLPGLTGDPAVYRAGARAIWDHRIATNGGGSAAGLAEYLRDGRFGQGYSNGIIPWDVSYYALAAARLDAVFPGEGFAAAAAEIAEVMWQDSFNSNPGYFDPHGGNQGQDPTYGETDYWWYSLGVAGLIRGFAAANVYPDEISDLVNLLLECQYADGAFSDQYGAASGFSDRSWQATAYAVMALYEAAEPTGQNLEALRQAATWIAMTQDDLSGAWIYSNGDHYPMLGGECTMAAAYGWLAGGAALATTIDGSDPATCGVAKTTTVDFHPGVATPGLRGYTVDFAITGGVTFDLTDINEGTAFADHANSQFFKQSNGDGTYTITAAIVGPTEGLLTSGDLFSVTLTTVAEGPVDFEILSYQLRDPDNGFFFADVSGAGFTVDCTAPAAVTGITAAPGHNQIEVSWNHDGQDTASYEVFRALWSDSLTETSSYPEYGQRATNVIPTRPLSHAEAVTSDEWELVAGIGAGTLTFTDTWPTGDSRGIFEYEVFAIDLATNASLPAAAGDRATNYWLGDVDPQVGDGDVDIHDITALANAFGTSDGQVAWNPICDVGPTDDYSRVGIPEPDGSINFEDLMIFAMNFGVVSGAKAQPASAGVIQVAWSQIAADRWALTLVEGNGLQGLRLRASLPQGALQNVTAGELLTGQDAPIFLRNVGEALDLSLAVFGQALGGAGVLCEVESTVEISLQDLVLTARSLDNSDLEVSFTQITGIEVPRVFNLSANFPNPFNPQTTLSYSLPQAEDVRLGIYSVDGRLVQVLVDEPRQAGHHEVVWSGRDEAGRPVATGTYFAVIRAGDFQQVRKMSLVK